MMRLGPLEIFILDRFRDLRATRLTLADIVGDCTLNRFNALKIALQDLEDHHRLLQHDDAGVFELTELGRKYANMAAC